MISARRGNDPAQLALALTGMSTGAQPSLWAELPDLVVPALAVAGELDEKFIDLSRRMAELCPKMRTVVVPEAGHNVRVEAPGEYVASLKGFLEAL